ncbi:AAEL007860-PA [Aedes aegypti]|uniref:AAEL007860-PA n=1 Tax=Aedes aegypti TaxID=7159 RepID=Q170N0_AEDAE|nr:AAEL007860-PA [Aedes aegypti]
MRMINRVRWNYGYGSVLKFLLGDRGASLFMNKFEKCILYRYFLIPSFTTSSEVGSIASTYSFIFRPV